jgi:asparagine synthase (glutamine-hydrolysing)
MDVASMAYSLEARSPLLDHHLMEFMARVPAGLKLRGSETKHLLKAALRGVLPAPILDRPKRGFGVPLGAWLRGSLREVLLDTVLSEKALSRGYFRPAAVRGMVEDQLNGNDRFRHVLWDLIMLERWHQMFIDEMPSPRGLALTSSPT